MPIQTCIVHLYYIRFTSVAICGLPAETGMCGENIRKWHYETESGLCKEFLYSGCEGNYNNFDTREDCEGRCPVTSRFSQLSLFFRSTD